MFAAFNARLLSPFHAPEHWGDNSYELAEPVFMRAELDQLPQIHSEIRMRWNLWKA